MNAADEPVRRGKVTRTLRAVSVAIGRWYAAGWIDRAESMTVPSEGWATAIWPDAQLALFLADQTRPDALVVRITPGRGTLVEVDATGARASEITGDVMQRIVRLDGLDEHERESLMRLVVLEERVRLVCEWGPSLDWADPHASTERLEAPDGRAVELAVPTP